MKNIFLIACATALLSACSGPSYYLMSAKTGAYHNQDYKVAAAPAASQPDAYAPLEASTNATPAPLPVNAPVQTRPQAPVQPVQSQNIPQTVPASAPVSQNLPAEENVPVTHIKKKVKKYSPRNILKTMASNTNIALIFLISGLLVMLLLKGVLASAVLIGVLLIIVGVVFLFI